MAIYRGSGSASSTSDQATIDEVTQQATNAASSATSAASSASSAASSASSASTSASTATTQASNASTSATNAASSASSASTSASSASTSASSASSSATAAAASETAAETAKTGALAAQTAAESAETNAASSASTASTAATTATTQASNASTSATSAASSATTASNAATAAESARDSTLAAFDSFDDRYLGAKTADPTLDNDGNALVGGALYFNTVDEVMKVYTGTQWVAAYADVSGALLAVNNLSDLNNVSSARTNLGLGTAATTASTDYATAAQGTLAASATQPGDNISTLTNDAGYSTTTGTVTSVAATVPLGLTVTGSPITSTGTLAVAYDTGYAIPTTAKQTQWDTAYGWGDHSAAGYAPLASPSLTGVPTAPTAVADTNTTQVATTAYVQGELANEANWNTAYGWGDHSTQNYVVSTGDTITGELIVDGNIGVGTNNPTVDSSLAGLSINASSQLVHINDVNGAMIKLSDPDTGANRGLGITIQGTDAAISNCESGSLRFGTGNTERMRINSNGTLSVSKSAYGTLTTDNDLSFDMNASNQFKCTPTTTAALTFTNITAGQSGNIWLDNSAGVVISAAASTYIASADLTTISTAGVYFLSYYSDGTNVMVSATPAVTSAGA